MDIFYTVNNNSNNNNNKDNEHWYEQVPKLVETGPEVKEIILWSQQVQTARTILAINWTI